MKMILTPTTTPDEYIDCLSSGWQKDFTVALRGAVRTAVPELHERLKWEHLVYFSHGPVLIIRAEPTRVLFGFMRGQQAESCALRPYAGCKKPAWRVRPDTLPKNHERKQRAKSLR